MHRGFISRRRPRRWYPPRWSAFSQEKVLARLFAAGPEGFRGGLSAENYIALTRTSRATATRDLQDLVAKGALTRSGERKHTRYALQVPATPGQGSDSMALL